MGRHVTTALVLFWKKGKLYHFSLKTLTGHLRNKKYPMLQICSSRKLACLYAGG